MNAPLDRTHAESVAYIRRIRARHARCVAYIATWEPRPMPADWGKR